MVLAVENDIFPFNRADVLQKRQINPIRFRIASADDSRDFVGLPVDDARQNHVSPASELRCQPDSSAFANSLSGAVSRKDDFLSLPERGQKIRLVQLLFFCIQLSELRVFLHKGTQTVATRIR